MKIPDLFLPKKDLEDKTKSLLEEVNPSIQPRYTKYEVIHTLTYAKGVAKLKEQGKKPFTFSENIEARIADYEFNGENAELFKTFLDFVTGIAYKANSTKFKLILRSDKLENIKSDFDQSFIPVDYNDEHGLDFDSQKGRYNQLLTREETKNHEFWLAAMNNNKEKLAEYVDLWFDKTKLEKGMGVYLRSYTSQDELRALAFDGDDNSVAGGYCLYDNARFVSGAQ